MIIFLLVIFLTAKIIETMSCGLGIPILTRTPSRNNTYSVEMQCYCPIDYYGIECRYHRGIHCYLTTNDVSPSIITAQNFNQNMQLKVQVSAQCYIQYTNNKYVPILNYFMGKLMTQGAIKQELQTGMKQSQIIWANDTNLFDETGGVKYQEGYNFTLDKNGNKHLSREDQIKIMNGPGPYKFKYNSSFLGFPLTDSYFQINPTIIMVTKNSIKLQNHELSFFNYEEYINFTSEVTLQTAKQEFQDQINKIDFKTIDQNLFDDIFKEAEKASQDLTNISKITTIPLIECSVNIHPREQAQFGMVRVQVAITQQYSQKYISKTSVNSAQVRVPIKIPGIGQATVYNKNFDPPTSRYIYFLLAVVCIAIIYLIYACYKKLKLKKLRKIQKAIEQDSELQEN